jgi:hypothetical protein
MTKANDPAFVGLYSRLVRYKDKKEVVSEEESMGLTKREWFAGLAMQGMLASCPEGVRFNPKERPLPLEAWAQYSVKMADALIAELAKEKP